MAPPPVIDGYTELTQVARGGFGVVYRARQARFDRVVALKVLSVTDLTPRDRERFDRECRAMGALSWHPNVVAVYDSGITDDDHPYLVMEYLPAGSLADHLGDGVEPWPHSVRAGIQVAGALGAAHAAGTLHRDLKPENLLVGPFGEAKLGDFGIAAIEGAGATTTGHASLTVAHVAPEIMAGERPSVVSDVYSLASTVHTLLAGRPPFAGERGEPVAALITRVLRSPAPRAEGVPADLADLLQRSLSKDPGARPQTAEAFGRALQAVQTANGEPVTELRLAPISGGRGTDATMGTDDTARGDPAVTVVGPAPVPGDDRPPPPPSSESAPAPPRPPKGRKWALVVGGVAVALLVVVVLGVVLLGGGGGSDGAGDTSGEAEAPPSAPTTAAGPDRGEAPPEEEAPEPPPEPAVVSEVAVDPTPVGIAAADDAVWVTHTVANGTVTRIDPETEEVVATIAVGSQPRGVAASDDAVYVANFGDDTVSRIDPATNRVVATIDAGPSPRGVAIVDDVLWVTNAGAGTVTRLDRSDDSVQATIVVGANPVRVVAAEDQVWVTNNDDDTLSRIDPERNSVVATIPTRDGPVDAAITEGAVWVSNAEGGAVLRIDPETDEVAARIRLTQGAVFTDSSEDALWVANSIDGTLSRIDLATDEVTDTLATGRGATGVVVVGGSVWVTNTGAGTVSRVEPA